MQNLLEQMVEEYNCQTTDDYRQALKECIQKIALLGLWRAKFFEHALFYGGTALRILHGLPRFSEDLDFSLLTVDENFSLLSYHQAIKDELESFGLVVDIIAKSEGEHKRQIDSAFIKAGTKINFIKIKVPFSIHGYIQSNELLKIKFEVDVRPPSSHGEEVMDIFRPLPFQIKTMPLPELFSGKIHAVLCRDWKSRPKGRDFYDYVWYMGRDVPINLKHLQERLIQSGHFMKGEILSKERCGELLIEKFKRVDFELAKKDVTPFLKKEYLLSLKYWNSDYFIKTVSQLKFQ